MFSDNFELADNPNNLISSILQLDNELQRFFRAGWPETWLQINLPLGSTRALLAIESGTVTTPRQVAEQLGVGRTTVTGLLDKLEAAHLIQREIDPNDRRSFILRLTMQGQELIRQIDAVRQEQLSRALSQMDSEALQALYTGLKALAETMTRDAQTPLETTSSSL